MLTIEDLIIQLSVTSRFPISSWDKQLMDSFSTQVSVGNSLTEKQGTLAVKIIKKYISSLNTILRTDITPLVQNPVFKHTFRQISNTRNIKIVPHEVYGKVVKVEFPYSDSYVTKIRSEKDNLDLAVWNKEEKSWIFSLTERNLVFLKNFIKEDNFSVDEEFKKYADQIDLVVNDIENFVPMLTLDNGIFKFKNFHKNMPILETTDILTALFEARKCGIFTWDEGISNFVESDQVSPITREFLKSDPTDSLFIDRKIHPFSELTDMITHMGPCLFVIPGGSELEKLEESVDFLKSIGIDNLSMSVMFRLPSDTHKKFNDFVKINQLNSPISENTKIVFISSKLPKPLLKSKIHFNSVINLGLSGVHYSMKNFIENHENLLIFSEKSRSKEFSFVLL